MRLFVAVDISDETRAQVVRVRDAMVRALSSVRTPPRVTWVKPENAHVTLRFIGEAPESTVEALAQAVGRGFDVAPFAIGWATVGTFPGGRSPRVIWLGAASGAADLTALADAVNHRLEPVLGPAESRPFAPHLTVGRVKDPGKGVDWPSLVGQVRAGHTVSPIDRVTLYQSRLSPRGPTYHPVWTWKLSSP
jgi:2'-5' RNA ligase